MFLRATIRKKNGKEHRHFSVVKNRRVPKITAAAIRSSLPLW